MAESEGETANTPSDQACGCVKFEEAISAKEAGVKALKSADLPAAIEHWENAVKLVDQAIGSSPQPTSFYHNDLVRYGDDGRFAIIETAFPQFEDYVLEDCGSMAMVKHKVGRHDFDYVSKRFTRSEIQSVPQEMFDIRLACLQNISLAALKMARASKRHVDLEEAIQRADQALDMDGKSAKALMRKGEALVELKDWYAASQVLTEAYKETKGKDKEVMRLLRTAVAFKGKGKGKNQGEANHLPPAFRERCKICDDPRCGGGKQCRTFIKRRPESDSSETGTDDEILRNMNESDWKEIKKGTDLEGLPVTTDMISKVLKPNSSGKAKAKPQPTAPNNPQHTNGSDEISRSAHKKDASISDDEVADDTPVTPTVPLVQCALDRLHYARDFFLERTQISSHWWLGFGAVGAIAVVGFFIRSNSGDSELVEVEL